MCMTAAARGAVGPAPPPVTIKITPIINRRLNFKIEFKMCVTAAARGAGQPPETIADSNLKSVIDSSLA